MLDIKILRENPQLVKDAMKKRNKDMDNLVDEVLAIDVQRRELTVKLDQLKQEQNAASREIPKIKKEGGDISAIMARMNEIKETDCAKLQLAQPDITEADRLRGVAVALKTDGTCTHSIRSIQHAWRIGE